MYIRKPFTNYLIPTAFSTIQTSILQKSRTKMKFTALFVFVASASASFVFPSNDTNCGFNLGTISACGFTTSRNFDIHSARVDYTGQAVFFWKNADCSGVRIATESSTCLKFPFIPRCVSISC